MRFSGLIPLALASSAVAVPFQHFKRYENSSEVSVTPGSSSGFSASVVATSSGAISSEIDTTITVDEYITITLPDTTLTVPTSATDEINKIESSAAAESSSEDITLTSTIIQYETLTSDGSETVQATNTYTTTVAPSAESSSAESSVAKTSKSSNDQVTTSTITRLTTITQGSSTLVEAVTDTETETGSGNQCTPETVTVTVTEGGKAATTSDDDVTSTVVLTSTLTTSYPVQAEFTNGDDVTTITSYVQVTSTQVYTTAAGSSSYGNSSIPATSSTIQAAASNNGTFYSSALPSATSGYEPVANERRGLLFNF